MWSFQWEPGFPDFKILWKTGLCLNLANPERPRVSRLTVSGVTRFRSGVAETGLRRRGDLDGGSRGEMWNRTRIGTLTLGEGA